MAQQCGLDCGGYECFQITPSNFWIGILTADDFALFCNAYLTVNATRRLRQYSLIAGTAPSPDCTSAPMKKPQFNVMLSKYFCQLGFCLVELPIGGKKA